MDQPTIDLKALLIEREDCDAGTVTKLREGLSQGGNQVKMLKEAADTLKKKLESAPPSTAKKLSLKLGVAQFFLGQTAQAVENLRQVDVPLGYFYLGRALAARHQSDEAIEAFAQAEKAGYAAPQVALQRAGVQRAKGNTTEARATLAKHADMASHSAEYHFQLGMCEIADGLVPKGVRALERSAELDPSHSGALFNLAFHNDLAGNDEEAISYYERCLKHPPVSKAVLNNLGVLYEDHDRYDRAIDCYGKLVNADALDERARLFHKDAMASQSMYYSPEEEQVTQASKQVLETPVSDFELSVRSRNCLKKMGIRSLGDLTRINETSLLGSKNFGETSLDEIRAMMVQRGLRIGQSLEPAGTAGGPPPPTGNEPSRFRPQPSLSPEEQALLSKPVNDLNLSVRARKCMTRLGIVALHDLTSRTANELLEAKNFGQTSLNEVREKLGQIGLKLRGE